MSFSTLGLSAQIQQNIQEKGYTKPTPVQLQVIPLALSGRDILAAAQTGTGKTAAFALPILQRLAEVPSEEGFKNPKALILVPTRELAMQVGANVEAYGQGLSPKTVTVYGGANIAPQTKKLAEGVDIIVATPGRLLDHIKLRGVSLSKVEYLVLDEADSMLDMGFIREVEKILDLLPKKRQTMLFSATLSGAVKRLSETILKKPQLVQVASYASSADNIKQTVYSVDKEQKNELLSFLIGSKNWKQVLIFCRTKAGAEEVAKDFESRGLSSVSIHSDKTHGARGRALVSFKEGKVRVLVATDLAARGLDIDNLPYVVNYDVPHIPTDYIHRIGRTGRAGHDGEAITLLSSTEAHSFKKIEELLGKTIPKIVIEGYEPAFVPEVKKKNSGKGGAAKKTESKPKTPGAFGNKYKKDAFAKKDTAPRKETKTGFRPADKKTEKRAPAKSGGRRK
jgi:ATP-dependent RNA helicase RhlE